MRYSLRSLDKFAPWFRGDIIILLGDDAPPRWLNTTHPRVKIVRHSSYFKNPEALPTFNSDAIQMNMHRISGLGPVLINWCDDYFLGRPVRPSDWIRNGKTVVYQEPNTIRGGRKGARSSLSCSWFSPHACGVQTLSG
jgi:Stealth protein CR2, conserved region 2